MIDLIKMGKNVGRLHARECVFADVNARFNEGHYVVVGEKGVGKSTLLRLLCGLTRPSYGRVRRRGSVVFPPGTAHDVAGLDTVEEFIKMLSVVYRNDYFKLRDFVVEFSCIGRFKDQPIMQMPSELRGQVMTALSLGIAADVYLFDKIRFFGSAEFKGQCESIYAQRLASASTIQVSKSLDLKDTWQGFKAVLVRKQNLEFYECYNDAIDALNDVARRSSYGTLAFADLLVREGARQDAICYLAEFTSKYPDSCEASTYHIRLLASEWDSDLNWVVSRHVGRFGYTLELCLLLAKRAEGQSNLQEALEWANRYLEEAPAGSEAQKIKARALEQLGDFSGAAQAWSSLVFQGATGLERFAVRAFMRDKDWDGASAFIDSLGLGDQANGLLERKCVCLINARRFGDLTEVIASLCSKNPVLTLSLIQRSVPHASPSQVLHMISKLESHILADARLEGPVRQIRDAILRRKNHCMRAGVSSDAESWASVHELLVIGGRLPH